MDKKDFVINYPENQRIIDRMKEDIHYSYSLHLFLIINRLMYKKFWNGI